jgi:hypothetical protein
MDLGKWLRVEWDRGAAIICVVVAIIVLLVGWFGVSATPYPAEQLPFILSSGIGSVLFLGIASTLWLSADMRDEWRKLDSIDEALRELAGSPLIDEGALTNGSGGVQRPAADSALHDSGYARSTDMADEELATEPVLVPSTATVRRRRPLRADDVATGSATSSARASR